MGRATGPQREQLDSFECDERAAGAVAGLGGHHDVHARAGRGCVERAAAADSHLDGALAAPERAAALSVLSAEQLGGQVAARCKGRDEPASDRLRSGRKRAARDVGRRHPPDREIPGLQPRAGSQVAGRHGDGHHGPRPALDAAHVAVHLRGRQRAARQRERQQKEAAAATDLRRHAASARGPGSSTGSSSVATTLILLAAKFKPAAARDGRCSCDAQSPAPPLARRRPSARPVAHLDPHGPGHAAAAQLDRAVTVLVRVGEQVAQRLRQPAPVGHNTRHPGVPFRVHGASHPTRRRHGQRLELLRLDQRRAPAAVPRGGKVVERKPQPHELRLHHRHVRVRARRPPHPLAHERERGRRTAQLVLGVGHQLSPAVAPAPQQARQRPATDREHPAHSASVSL